MELDSELLDTIFLACNRASVSEALSSIPGDELPTEDQFQGMFINFIPEKDLAWGELFPKISLWLAKREHDRKEKERRKPRNRGNI